MKGQEHANWHMRSTLSKYHEDIDGFAHRNSLWAKSLRLLSTICLIGIFPSFLYNKTVGRKEQEFHKLYTPYEIIEQEGNCLLNTGIDLMWDLITAVDTTNIFDNTNAEIGVGDSSTAASASQTDLQAASNKLNKGMEATFPTSASQKATFKSSFGAAEGNYAWNEWVVREKQTDVCLNRKVESLGTKSTGTWTLEVDITLS